MHRMLSIPLTLVLFLVLSSTTSAFDYESLRSTNTFSLYDFDVYDDVIDLGSLSKVKGHYLFTNLHNSAGVDNFQLGYAGNPFRIGTLSILFNTTTSDYRNNSSQTTTTFTNVYDDSGNPITVDKTVTQTSDYTALGDDLSDYRIAYGIGLRELSLGLAYERHTSKTIEESGSTTLTDSTNLLNGVLISSTESSTEEKWRDNTRTNAILLGSEYENGPVILELDGLLSWGETDRDILDYTEVYNESQASGYYYNSLRKRLGLDGGGQDPEENTEFTGYGIDLTLTYMLTDRFRMKGYAGFYSESSDLNNKTYSNTFTSVEKIPLGNNGVYDTIETRAESYLERFSGKVDEDQYYRLGFKGYYDFSTNVGFAFGLFYEPHKTETDTPYTVSTNNIIRYDSNGDGDLNDYDPLNNINDYIRTQTGTYSMRYKKTIEEDAISIPVAVEFKTTDRLTIRAGAQYKLVRSKTEESRRYVSGSQQITTTTTYASGEVEVTQNDYQIPPDTKSSNSYTASSTEYRLGLGYMVSENLDFSLMAGVQDREGVLGASGWDIYSQITLSF